VSEAQFITAMCDRVTVPAAPEGPGDDAAVHEGSVSTVDLMIEGVHFTRAHPPLWLGAKLLAVNISDVGAMAAKPSRFVLSAALPEETPEGWWNALSDGIGELAERVGVALVGGDVTRSPGAIMLGITAWGALEGRPPLLRSGGQPGDLLMLHSPQGIGRSHCGLNEWLTRDVGGWGSTPPDNPSVCLEAHLNPKTSWNVGPWAGDNGARAAMDCSDGLVADLPRLAAASDVRLLVDLDALPPDEHCRGMDELERASGGEDYGLLVLVPPLLRARFEGAGFIVLGHAHDGHGVHWSKGGVPVDPGAPSFDHFPQP